MPSCSAVSLKDAVLAARQPLSEPVWMKPTCHVGVGLGLHPKAPGCPVLRRCRTTGRPPWPLRATRPRFGRIDRVVIVWSPPLNTRQAWPWAHSMPAWEPTLEPPPTTFVARRQPRARLSSGSLPIGTSSYPMLPRRRAVSASWSSKRAACAHAEPNRRQPDPGARYPRVRRTSRLDETRDRRRVGSRPYATR